MSPSIDQRQDREFASELKFVVSRRLAERIRVWARARLAPDPNASADVSDGYPVTSLYFDTQHFDVFHRKGSFARSKYRIRRYGPSEVVFLERKLKTRGLVSKRRSIVPMNDLERLADAEPDRGWTGHWYHQRLLARQLRPVCQISYRRAARVSMTRYGPIRLTLDEDIRTLAGCGLALNGAEEGALLLENQLVLELKYRFEMPVLFKRLVEEFALNPQPVSKYRLAVVASRLVTEPVSKLPARGIWRHQYA